MQAGSSKSNPRIAVLGGGVTGLSAAFWTARLIPSATIVLIEKQARLGGLIGTRISGGRCLESGPLSFPASAPMTRELLQSARAEGACLKGAPSKGLGLWNGRRVVPFSRSVAGILRSRLLSPLCLLRLLAEPFIAKGAVADESVAAFFRRRTGREFLEAVMEPMSASIQAGDPAVMDMAANYPVLHGYEKRWGSLAKGLWKNHRASGASGQVAPAMVAGVTGNRAVIAAIEDALIALGVKIRTGAGIASMRIADGGMAIRSATDPSEERFDAVISCLPTYALAEVWTDAPHAVREFLESVPYAPIAAGNLSYRKGDLARGFPGEGCLVQGRSAAKVLSVFLPSRMFGERCPGNEELVRVLAGGERFRRAIDLSDPEFGRICADAVGRMWKTRAEPIAFECVRHERALPQLLTGHPRAAARAREAAHRSAPGLFLAGTGFSGAGIEKGVAEGKRAAEEVCALFPEAA